MTIDRDTPEPLESRVEALEVRCAYQDETIEDLNKVVVEQWSRMEQMLRRIAALEDRLRDLSERSPGEPEDEPPPPHY